MRLSPCSFDQACAFIAAHHRHLPPPQGHKFSVAVEDAEGRLRGVVTVGRPVSRWLDDGHTLEITRCCSDGAKNAPSMLYGAAWRAAKALGYTRLVTYTLEAEAGSSLRGAGWRVVGKTKGGEWSRPSRPRQSSRQPGQKTLWEAM